MLFDPFGVLRVALLHQHADTPNMSNTRIHWNPDSMTQFLEERVERYFKKYRLLSPNSLFWIFYPRRFKIIPELVKKLLDGKYHPEPMKRFYFKDHVVETWQFADRIIHALIYAIIKPTIKHIIPSTCMHVQGPCGIVRAVPMGSGLHLTHVCLNNITLFYLTSEQTCVK